MNNNLSDFRELYLSTRKEKEEEIKKLRSTIETAKADIGEAEKDIEDSIKTATPELFEDARDRKAKAETNLEFCKLRLSRINDDFITEETSDKFIDGVLNAEKAMTEEYTKAAKRKLEELESITKAYRADIKEAESLMNDWTRDVHANYRTFGKASYVQPDGTRKDRSPKPVKVRGDLHFEYTGTDLSQQVLDFTRRAGV